MNEKNIFVISVAFAAIMGCTSYSSRLQTDDVAEINAVIKEIKAGSDYGAFDKLLNDPSVSDVAKARILIVQGPDTVAREVFSHGQFPGVASPWLTQGVMDALYMQTTDRMKEGILNSGTLANQNEKCEKSLRANKLADDFRNRMFSSIKSEDRKTTFAQTAAFDTSVCHLKAKVYLKSLAINYLVANRKFDLELSDAQCENLLPAVFGRANAVGPSPLGENRDAYVAFVKNNRSFAKYCVRQLTNGRIGKHLQIADTDLFFQVVFGELAADKAKYADVLLSECATRMPKDIWLDKMKALGEVDSETAARMFAVLPDQDCRNCLLAKVKRCPPKFVASVFSAPDFAPRYDRSMIEVFSAAVMEEADEGAREKMARRILGAGFKDCSGLVNYGRLAAYVKSVDDRIAAEKRAEEERIAARRKAEEVARKKAEAEARERARIAKIAAEKAAAEARERERLAKIAAAKAEAERQARLAEEKKITVFGFKLGSRPPSDSKLEVKVTGESRLSLDKNVALVDYVRLKGEFMGMHVAELLYTPISQQLFNIELSKNVKGNVGLDSLADMVAANEEFSKVVSLFEEKYGKKFSVSNTKSSGMYYDQHGRSAMLHINGMFVNIELLQKKDARDSVLTITVRHVALANLAEQESPEYQKRKSVAERDAARNIL